MPVLPGLGAVTAALLAAGSIIGVSSASTTSVTADGGEWTTRLTAACNRIPHRIERVEKLQTRLHADAGTQGSIAFLQARIDRARHEGQDDVATLLGDRLAVRKDLDSQLPDVLARLKDARSVCRDHSHSSASATGSST
jgi:hypothetical protein